MDSRVIPRKPARLRATLPSQLPPQPDERATESQRLLVESQRIIHESQQVRAEGRRVRAENRRLRADAKRGRLECVNALLDLSCTLAAMVAEKQRSQTVKESQRNIALAAYTDVRVMISQPGWNAMERQALEPKLTKLHELLLDLSSRERYGERALGDGSLEKSNPEDSRELTGRECEVLKHIVEGHRTKDVAKILGTSVKTVACHRYKIMRKLGVHDTATLVRYAIRNGFV